MKFTSINHTRFSNHQLDYSGSKDNCISDLERWCKRHDVIWAHLFVEETGELVHTFKEQKK